MSEKISSIICASIRVKTRHTKDLRLIAARVARAPLRFATNFDPGAISAKIAALSACLSNLIFFARFLHSRLAAEQEEDPKAQEAAAAGPCVLGAR